MLANRILPVGAFALMRLVGCVHPAEMAPASAPPPATAVQASYEPAPPREEVQVGFATWYGAALAGRTTASGERFNPNALTAAHRSLPFGTWVEVTRMDTGASVRVKITDRGPFGHEERIIDLSRAAADQIGLIKAGVTKVQLKIVETP